MAKPTDRQIDLIMRISDEISWLRNTNDLDSPSHWTLIEEFVQHELDEGLSDMDKQQLDDALCTILSVIRHNK